MIQSLWELMSHEVDLLEIPIDTGQCFAWHVPLEIENNKYSGHAWRSLIQVGTQEHNFEM